MPAAPAMGPCPGGEIVEHLAKELPSRGVLVRGHHDVEYTHEVECKVGPRSYTLSVSYDWVSKGWWEVSWQPTLGRFRKLLGASEENELRCLATAVSGALDVLPGIQERRWYQSYGVNVGPTASHTSAPEIA